MSPVVAIQQILEAISNSSSSVETMDTAVLSDKRLLKTLSPSHTLALALSRVGTPHQGINAGTLSDLANLSAEDFGPPLHSLVIVGSRLHPMEARYAGRWAVEGGSWKEIAKEVYGIADDD